MKALLSFANMLLAASIICASCTSEKKQEVASQTTEQKDSVVAVEQTDTTEKNAVPPIAAVKKTTAASTPFSNVTRWEIDFISVTTRFIEITKEEADRIENGDYGEYAEYFKDYDAFVNEIGDEYNITFHDDVVERSRTITDAKVVSKLNKMMEDKRYAEYRKDVTIEGNTASATWYSGNRGGGIADDFPSELVDKIYN